MVPTTDTVRFGYLMEKLLEVNRSVLYTGTTGVGKSVIAKGILLDLSSKVYKHDRNFSKCAFDHFCTS